MSSFRQLNQKLATITQACSVLLYKMW